MEIDKVRRGLECLTQMTSCVGCPYWDCGRTRKECLSHIGKDALAMLKDQQNVISGLKVINDGLCEAVTEQKQIVRCKDCKWAEVSDNEHTWCDHVDHEFCHNNDWFCADGIAKDTDVPNK